MHDTMQDMTPLSKRPLSPEAETRIRRIFLRELIRITDTQEMNSLMKAMLTESEQLMVAKRLTAFVLIGQSWTDVRIARVLHVTRATANRFRVVYMHARDRDEQVIKTVNKLTRSGMVKELLAEFLKYALPAALGRIPK